MQKCDATRLFVHPSLLHQTLVAAEEACFSPERVYLLEGRSEERPGYSTCIEKIRDNKVPRHPVEDADVDTLAYLVFSSGTSGKPKAVMATHGNLNFTLLQFITLVLERYQIRPVGRVVSSDWTVFAYNNLTYSVLRKTSQSLCAIEHSAMFTPSIISCYGTILLCYLTTINMLIKTSSPSRTFIVPSTCIILPEWDIERVLDLVPKYVSISNNCDLLNSLHQAQSLFHAPCAFPDSGTYPTP